MFKKSKPKSDSIKDFNTAIPESIRSRIKWNDEVTTDKSQFIPELLESETYTVKKDDKRPSDVLQ